MGLTLIFKETKLHISEFLLGTKSAEVYKKEREKRAVLERETISWEGEEAWMGLFWPSFSTSSLNRPEVFKRFPFEEEKTVVLSFREERVECEKREERELQFRNQPL